MFFSLRQIQEKSIEQSQELYIVFEDFRKAFDTVDREMLWKVLSVFGCPDYFVKIVKKFDTGTKGRVAVGSDVSEEIQMSHGIKQGCVLAPAQFTLFLTVVLVILHQSVSEGVYIRTREDVKLFNLAILKTKTKNCLRPITELLFTDDSFSSYE